MNRVKITTFTPDNHHDTDTIIIRPPQAYEMAEVITLKNSVLNRTVGQPDQIDLSDTDRRTDTIHVAAFDGNHVIATARFDRASGNGAETYLVRRVATDPHYRRRGIGARAMQLGESIAHEQFGARHFVLHARQDAIPFYEHLGYTLTGVTVTHDGDENWEMTKGA